MTNRRQVVRWLGYAAIIAGGALVIVGTLGEQLRPAASDPGLPESRLATVSLAEGAVTDVSTRAPALVQQPPTATPTPEPIVPTRTPSRMPSSPTPTRTRTPTAMVTRAVGRASATPGVTLGVTTTAPQATPTPALAVTDTVQPSATVVPTTAATAASTLIPVKSGELKVPAGELFRVGVSMAYSIDQLWYLEALGVGWVMDWHVRGATALPQGVDYAQTVRMRDGRLTTDAATLTAVAAARPGSLWLISNEPDVRWQDNTPPDVYAVLYREAYAAIKAGDPSAVVAAGGIAQPTELRLRYLDQALRVYQQLYGTSLPADAWHIHDYMLREERDSWGVDIPPGLPDNQGVLYSIQDSGNLEAFKAQIWAFRRWMSSRGYGGLPLVISEFGIPMPPDYGFPPATVAEFLRETWRFMLTATDTALGDPSDGGRLVQRWCWFSFWTSEYPTGNLVESMQGDWTALGRSWIEMIP